MPRALTCNDRLCNSVLQWVEGRCWATWVDCSPRAIQALSWKVDCYLLSAVFPTTKRLPTGWSMSGLDSLLRTALTVQSTSMTSSQTADNSESPKKSGEEDLSDSPSVSPPDLLMPTAITLAHMLETHFWMSVDSQQGTQQWGRQPGRSADARQLGVLLSLVVFIGGLACSAGKDPSDTHTHTHAVATTANSDEQSQEESPSSGSRQPPGDQDVPEANGADASQSEGGRHDASTSDQQMSGQSEEAAVPQPVPPAALPQHACQEVCLQVSSTAYMQQDTSDLGD